MPVTTVYYPGNMPGTDTTRQYVFPRNQVADFNNSCAGNSPRLARHNAFTVQTTSPVQYSTTATTVSTSPEYFTIGSYNVTNHVLGYGAFSEVRLGYCTISGQTVAVKCIPRAKISADAWKRIEKEHHMLQKLRGHPGIIQLYDVLASKDYVFQVFEYIHGMDLLSFLDKWERLDESLYKNIMKQLFVAVKLCHDNNIIHLDIKLENVMLEAETGRVVLIDFGFAEEIDPRYPCLSKKCGSPHYCAPEIVSSVLYDPKKAEVWSLGVLLYLLAVGQFPFDDENAEPGEENVVAILNKIRTGYVYIPDYLSMPLKFLLHSMLCLNPAQRISLDEILHHPWVCSL